MTACHMSPGSIQMTVASLVLGCTPLSGLRLLSSITLGTAVHFLFNSGCVHVWKPKCSCELSCLRMQMYLLLPHCWRDLLQFFSVPLVSACTEAQCIYIKIKSCALQLTCRCCSDGWMNEMHAWSLTKKIYVDSWNGFQPCPLLWICL